MVSRDPAHPSPTIRRANDADVETMTELARTAYAKYVERIGREPEPMTDDYATVVHENEVWLAEEDGNLVGMLVLRAADSHVLLKNVAVAPGAQKLGTGKLLLDLADERARQQGLAEVRLYTNVVMTENLAYYLRHGYHETHRATDDDFERVYLTKPLVTKWSRSPAD